MARAAAYDEWEDSGMVVTDEGCLEYDPQKWAQVRVGEVVQAAQLLMRMQQTNQPKPKTLDASAKRLIDVATWYCRSLGLEGLDRDAVTTLPPPSSAAGKKLSAAALKTSAPEVLQVLREHAEVALRGCVTIGRRCEGQRKADGKWSKENRSHSNKLANAILKEMRTCDKLLELWASTTKGSEGE